MAKRKKVKKSEEDVQPKLHSICALWIEDYQGFLKNITLNFHSRVKFDISLEEEIVKISASENPNYIPNFFDLEPRNEVRSVAGLIGKNGVGKTLVSKVLRDIIGGDDPRIDFILVTEYIEPDGSSSFYAKNWTELEVVIQDGGGLNIEIGPNNQHENIDGALTRRPYGKISGAEVIYYSPIVDFSNIEILSKDPAGIDLSTNHLLMSEFEKLTSSRGEFKASNLFQISRAEDFKRQYEMIYEMSTFELPEGLSIHRDDIVVRIVDLNISLYAIYDDHNGRNIPTSYKQLLRYIADKSTEERQALATERFSLRDLRDEDTSTEELGILKEMVVLAFSVALVKFFVYNLNRENNHIRKDVTYVKEDFESLSCVEAVHEFFNRLEVVDGKKFSNCLDAFRGFDLEILDSSETSHEPVLKLGSDDLVSLYSWELNLSAELAERQIGTFKGETISFLEFDWGISLSSGEKAYLDLFSRIYSAKKQMNSWLSPAHADEYTWPDLIIILLDEAELGFHPRWQQFYVNELLKNLPKIFCRPGTKTKHGTLINYTPIQLLITSHSPFIASDLPDFNVNRIDIYKEKDKDKDEAEGETENKELPVVRPMELDERTFAANILNLFSSGFYLDQSLIGSFATSKLDKLIKTLRQDPDSNDISASLSQTQKEEIESILEIIGEPVIRHRLKEMFEERFGLSLTKDELIKFHEDEIKRLQEE